MPRDSHQGDRHKLLGLETKLILNLCRDGNKRVGQAVAMVLSRIQVTATRIEHSRAIEDALATAHQNDLSV
jgi:protein tyrosine/serine phosphatase